MVDDYGGYKALFSSHDKTAACIELACLAHARRKFFDLHHANQSPMAFEALQRIGQLYTIEAEGKQLTINERKILRVEKSVPTLKSLHDWLIHTRVTCVK